MYENKVHKTRIFSKLSKDILTSSLETIHLNLILLIPKTQEAVNLNKDRDYSAYFSIKNTQLSIKSVD